MILPEEFKKRMSDYLGDQFDAFIATFDEPALKGIRLSTMKVAPEEQEKIVSELQSDIKRVPWTSCGFYSDAEYSGKDPYYHAGVYYPQEPSAMLPAEVIAAKPGEIILDLCAAPGGKACRIGEDLKGRGIIVANEINSERSKALNRNIERTGITNCIILNESPDNIARCLPTFFDKILIDAPCSGEGMFRRDPKAVKSWENYGPMGVSKLQYEIITEAAKALKPGGSIVYSTCTFAEIEDEGIISRFLADHPDIEIVPHPEIKGITHIMEGPMKGCMRIWPHLSAGDGHFCVHLRNTSGSASEYNIEPVPSHGSIVDKEVACMIRFLSDFLAQESLEEIKEKCSRQVLVQGSGIYLMPLNSKLLNKLRIVKSGLFMGEIKVTKTERVFVPSNSFPLTLSKAMIRPDSAVNFARDDDNLFRYLKGETINIDISDDRFSQVKQKGTVVIMVNGYPLGLGKIQNGTIKNLYPKAWRLV